VRIRASIVSNRARACGIVDRGEMRPVPRALPQAQRTEKVSERASGWLVERVQLSIDRRLEPTTHSYRRVSSYARGASFAVRLTA